MTSRIPCFWLEPTDRLRRFYRRYRATTVFTPDHTPVRECPYHGYHNARTALDEVPAIWGTRDERRVLENVYDARDFAPPAFPSQCSCGYHFVQADAWQIFTELVYRRADTGAELTLLDAPAGAMWDAWWMGDRFRGPDGYALTVKLPGGCDWTVDGPSRWTRSGAPPLVTARPSIGIPTASGGWAYHGFLTNGVLEAC